MGLVALVVYYVSHNVIHIYCVVPFGDLNGVLVPGGETLLVAVLENMFSAG